jgi:hypothetical protein
LTPAIDRPPLSSRSCNPFVEIHGVALTHDIRFGSPFPSACGVLATTSLNLLKPLLKRALWPLAAGLAGAGITANQVKIISLIGSIIVGSLLSVHADGGAVWGLLPVWMLVRMALATIDGTLAVDFGQKSRQGAS